MATSVTQAQQDKIAQLYVSLFNRAPDAGGFSGWVESLAKGTSLNVIAQDFYLSPEGQATYSRALTNQQFVEAFYSKFLGRNLTTEDQGGITYWVGRLGETGAKHGAIAAEIIKNVVNYTGTDPVVLASKNLINNKVAVGEYYALTLNGNVANAAAAVAGVTATQTVAEALATATNANAQIFTLTKDVATTTGTSGNDTFSGILDTAAAPNDGTYQIGDVIDGGAGTDTLNLTLITGNPAAAARADVKNVEVINIRNISGGAADFGAAQISGATQIWSSESNQDLTVSSVANLVAVGLNKTAKNITVKFADTVVAGTADALTVALNEAGTKAAASTVTVTNQTGTANVIEALTVSSTGAKTNYVDVTGVGNAVKTITVTGAAALEVTVDPTAVVTVDASAATGGVKVTGTLVGTAAAGLTVTGSAAADQFTIDLTNKAVVNAGAGNDIVTLAAVASLTSTDSVAGGDGVDTLVLGHADAALVAVNAARTVITGFENLKIADALVNADGFDISKFGINSLIVGADVTTATTVSGFSSGATVEFNLATAQTSALNVGIKNATDAGTDSDTLNIKINTNVPTDAAPGTAALVDVKVGVDGINILNVSTADSDATTKGGVEDGYSLTLTNASNVSAINASGASALSFTSGVATNALKTFDGTGLTATANLTVDLSGFGGTQGVEVKGGAGVNTITGTGLADIITGGAKDDVLVGGAGNDKISGGDGKDTITGGTGADVLTGGTGVDTFVIAVGDSLVATADSITDLVLGVGGDIIKFNGGATTPTAANIVSLSAASQSIVTATATLAAAATQVAVETAGVKIVTLFTYGTDTYLMYNDANDNTFDAGADALIKITGVTGTLDASNIFVS